MNQFKILAINPGSTSTKVALSQDGEVLFSSNVSHDAEVLKQFAEIDDQFDYRKQTILDALQAAGYSLNDTDAFVGRCGGFTSMAGGIYAITDKVLADCMSGRYVRHPATLGGPLAASFAEQYGGRAFIVNTPDTDELCDLARITGLKDVFRDSKIHALNQKEIGIRYAATMGKRYSETNLIICHIGGGISVTAHQQGMMIDSNDIAQGDGPMAPTRCGALPVKDVVRMCYSGEYTERQMYDKITKTGGLIDHLGTADAREVSTRVDAGDHYAKLIYDAMIYQIGKTAGSMAAVLHGKVDGIVLTGGISYDKYVTEALSKMLSFIAPVTVMAGEFEMEALVAGATRALSGEEAVLTYTGIPVWSGF